MENRPTVVIRRAEPDDALVISEFNTRLAQETEELELDAKTIRAGVGALLGDSTRGRYFVAEVDASVIGQIMHTWEWSDWRNGYFWWLQSVYVRQDFRQQGVFRMLYEHLCRLAEADPHVVGIRLYVEQENQTARKTYQQMGMAGTPYRVMEFLVNKTT